MAMEVLVYGRYAKINYSFIVKELCRNSVYNQNKIYLKNNCNDEAYTHSVLFIKVDEGAPMLQRHSIDFERYLNNRVPNGSF